MADIEKEEVINELTKELKKAKKKKKKFVDEEGKEWDLEEFDDTHSWSKVKKNKRK